MSAPIQPPWHAPSLVWLCMPADVARDLPHPLPEIHPIGVPPPRDPNAHLQQLLGQPEILQEVRQALERTNSLALWVSAF